MASLWSSEFDYVVAVAWQMVYGASKESYNVYKFII